MKNKSVSDDVRKIGQIPIVPKLLDIVCQVTKMRFAAVARVTEEQWVVCSVIDNIRFGLQPGDELDVKKTICDEIRDSHKIVVSNDAENDPEYKDHPVPKLYGIKSYISVPILTSDGKFFGTLCAFDFEKRDVKNDETIAMFTSFAEIIAYQLEMLDLMQDNTLALASQKAVGKVLQSSYNTQSLDLAQSNRNLAESTTLVLEQQKELEGNQRSLRLMADEIDSFSYISSHDLQEPLRKIQMISKMIHDDGSNSLSIKSAENLLKIDRAAERMRMLINDLLTFNTNSKGKNKFVHTDLRALVDQLVSEMDDEFSRSKAQIEISGHCELFAIPFQIRQAIYNLLSNSIKFSKSSVAPRITVTIGKEMPPTESGQSDLPFENYGYISVEDNGIGFNMQFKEKIFQIFEQLNDVPANKSTGIGLAIVRRVVDNHTGIISVQGETGLGARIILYFPLLMDQKEF